MNIAHALEQRLAAALAGLAADPAKYASMVRQAQDARHGDYQANCAMPLSKELGAKPPDVARQIVERLDLGDMLETPEIAGPGFINLRLKPEWLAKQLQAMSNDRLGVEPVSRPKTFVIDYSSPNVAKPLHVGHLRSSIIGDALARILLFLGHKVITDNHLGDWGTQFGILLYGYKHLRDDAAYQADPVQELARIYMEVRKQFKKKETEDENAPVPDDPVQDACRLETAKLHQGDPENVALWKQFMPHCLEEIQHIYTRLGLLPFDHTHGESFYQPMLADVVKDLTAKGIAEESQGAKVIFFGDPEKVPPAIVQKRDGAFTYMTSDLATIRYRVKELNPDAMLYVVGMPQAVHFKNLFAAARRWGYEKVELEHVAFGSVLSAAGKMLATRKGGNTLLEELLDDAVARAEQVFLAGTEDVSEFSDQEKRAIYEAVGIAAVKYADLCQARTSDYKFDLAKMTATDGNTATYMQYAYARNRSILRKSGEDEQRLRDNPPTPILATPHERALALMLLRFPEALAAATADYRPNLITSYLWDLSRTYSGFNTNCPVLKAETPALRQSRLLLCDLTARVIRQGLDLLGIRTVERM